MPRPLSPQAGLDQQEIEGQLLTYTSELLQEPLVVIGPVQAVLYAASSARDTDWVVRLCDVWPDGRSIKVCDGVSAPASANSLAEESLLEPGQVYRYEIDMTATAQTFLPGHRLRIHVASSDFPKYDRNLNTGGPLVRRKQGQAAMNTVFHDTQRPSHVILPLV